MKYDKVQIGDVCQIERKHINPQAGATYTLYSLPAFDNRQVPETIDGAAIKSGKLAVQENMILYNKLNVKYKRVWNIHKLDGVNCICSTEFFPLLINRQRMTQDFLYYQLIGKDLTDAMYMARQGTSCSQQRISENSLFSYEISCPPIDVQEKIAGILKAFDEKIHLNTEINNNLEQQVMAVYVNKFVDNDNSERYTCRADEYFDISIGKTPPRKEPQWFSHNPNDITWVSISDMGSCGLYISTSSEQLTPMAIKAYNVKVVPDNTVLLSFKLTIGRVAITDGEMTTNEAIAHFKTDDKSINEYLYCYLKRFNYQTMGSTSSIATAVNSKIIKGMPFVVPTDEELAEFHGFAAPMFSLIKSNLKEIENLTNTRDSLLPKLMSGEIDVSDIAL